MLPAALALIAAAIGVALWTVLSSADEKATVRASLRQLDGYEVDNVRDQELLRPMRERTVQPFMDRLVDFGKKFSPDGYVDKVKVRLTSAGISGSDAPDR